ncbi:MAG: DNA polymerase III subunit epsilon [Thiothrix sp.]|nr:MAG: DNA polymerase III subunit epsilon [Thiothrix sp.]
MRQIVLDTETTGLDPKEGHRIIEIGCVELVDRRLTGNDYHQYLQPDRLVDEGAMKVHGITNEYLVDKPRMGDVAKDFLDYVRDAELIIHNAPFDVGFLNHEFRLLGAGWKKIESYCEIFDSLEMARRLRPGQRNSLDALCKSYEIDNSNRELHGALLDARILAEVYLAMTGGQTSLSLGEDEAETETEGIASRTIQKIDKKVSLKVIQANADESTEHEAMLKLISKASNDSLLWPAAE